MSDTEIDPSRRSFFSSLFRKTTDFAVRVVDAQVVAQAVAPASNWIRPPFALDELQFLSACTRCVACIDACPHGTILPLAPHHGLRVAGTPVLDLQNKACHLCADWPCVAACEPGALKLPVQEEGSAPPLPRLADVSIDMLTCLPHNGPECGACESSCPVPGAMVWNQCKPYIVPQLCVGCGLCREACIVDPKSVLVKAYYKKSAPTISTEKQLPLEAGG